MPQYQQMDFKNVVSIHSGNLFSHKEEWNFVIHKENIILSEISQAQKAKNCVFPHMQIIDLKQMQ
jgi:hypothetical protein